MTNDELEEYWDQVATWRELYWDQVDAEIIERL